MVYLYVKTHNKTGLKYFGKTTRKDFEKYLGSGKYWRRHLAVHGKDFTTELIASFNLEHECCEFAIKFSIDNDIVNSTNWANLKEENGLDGSPKGVSLSETHKQNISKSLLGKSFLKSEKAKENMKVAQKKRAQKDIEMGKNPFQGEHGSELAKSRTKRLIENGSHNFQKSTLVVDKSGNRKNISTDLFWSQRGAKEDWEYVHITSKEGKLRLKTAKENI
jgi:hypothetical protein